MTLVSTLGQALDQIERIKQQQDLFGQLQLQVATGKKTQTFSGLESNAIISERSRSEFNQLDMYLNNIIRGETRVNQMLNALDQIKTQAQNALNAIAGQPQQGDFDLSIVENISESAFEFVSNLLNLKDGDTYLFAGSDTGTSPFSDNGALDSFIRNLNVLWTTGQLNHTAPETITDEYINQIQNIPETILGYPGSLNNAGKVFVTADDGVELDYTVMANNPALKDIVTALGVLKNLPAVLNAPPPQGQIVSQANLVALTGGLNIDSYPGAPAAPNDQFYLRFDNGGANDSGPITIDLSDIASTPGYSVPADFPSGAEALAAYINDVVVPTLSPPLNATTNAFINGQGQLVIGSETEIELSLSGSNPMTANELSVLGLSEGITAPTNNESKDAFFQVFNELGRMLALAIDDIDQIQYKLNNVQVGMDQAKQTHKYDKNTLLNTISEVEDIDLTEVATSLNILQLQLEASFRVTAAVSNLSLVNFL
jgi:flagellin-like hook-associated protein FlgL